MSWSRNSSASKDGARSCIGVGAVADLIAAFPPEKRPDGRLPRYVYMETPNGDYYVGYDMKVVCIPRCCWSLK